MESGTTLALMVIAVLVCLGALAVSYVVYVKKSNLPVEDKDLKGWEKVSANKLYFDEIYHFLFVRPIEWLSIKGHQFIELFILNGIVIVSTKSIEMTGNLVKKMQTGKTDWYILWMVFGIVGFVIYYLLNF